jgi:lipoate-protein ligase A
VVIGKGSDPDDELVFDNIKTDRIPVIRRDSGGCAVVLSNEMAVVSFSVINDPDKNNTDYFHLFNSLIMDALEKQGINDLAFNGISDITLNGSKVAGSAIYRKRENVLYHVVLNLSGSTSQMERYLKIPSRQPDYRKNRSHKDFVTSFAAQGYTVNLARFESDLKTSFLLQIK